MAPLWYKTIKVLELFAGTRSIGKAFEAKGHEVYSIEWNKDFENIDLYADIGKVTAQEILNKDIEYIVAKALLVQLHLMVVGSVHVMDCI